eukprot:CAMPEP_0198658316 /NCGR_PEP_ID=MMETSP1467-20131203/24232_1 /TAXON_ID=1462469 /ORGANISM="unid. sp., Strain CCMP2135" /LENGTH=39 /DNA_ID= /DNA_START= /DNA_END= /DNA_ORIENTATION=
MMLNAVVYRESKGGPEARPCICGEQAHVRSWAARPLALV